MAWEEAEIFPDGVGSVATVRLADCGSNGRKKPVKNDPIDPAQRWWLEAEL